MAAAALTVLNVGVAQAHVHVHPDSTASGSYSALTFRVPNESATASTVKVAVELPQNTPFLSVSTKPVPGWSVATVEAALPKPVEVEGTTITKAIRTVTWTADQEARIGPGQYQEFSVSVGPLPAPGTVTLPVVQTYSDGKVVNWNEPTPASGVEPENPAPTLVVTAAIPGDDDGDAVNPTSEASAPARSDLTARTLSGAALVVAVAGLAVAVVALRRRSTSGGQSV